MVKNGIKLVYLWYKGLTRYIYAPSLLRRYGPCFAMYIAKAKLGLLGRELI